MKLPPGFPVRVTAAFGTGIICTAVAAFWCRLPFLSAVLVVGAEMVALGYYLVVLWNPPVKSLFGISGPSSAIQNCGVCNSSEELDWDRMQRPSKINSGSFYEEYHGHRLEHLVRVRSHLVDHGCGRFVYFCGDSSLDNKHWFFNGFQLKRKQMRSETFTAPACNGYEGVLTAPCRMVQDVSYHMNDLAAERFGSGKVCTVMTSVEESTIEDRGQEGLLLQDAFIRDHITEQDCLIVSVGGNDIALSPTLRTAVNMFALTRSPEFLIRLGLAPGLGYFETLFHGRIQALIRRVLSKKRPAKVLVCMIYYPDPKSGGSWADHTLKLLGYDSSPSKLQLIIRKLFQRICRRGFTLPQQGHTEIEPFPLFQVLTDHSDYCQRVEPSVTGGRKMAAAFLHALFPEN